MNNDNRTIKWDEKNIKYFRLENSIGIEYENKWKNSYLLPSILVWLT